MKKICFLFLSFFMFFSFANAHIKDVQFVGGTGGSKILELNMSEDSLNTSGVIYDRNASLVYEITYTNDSDLDKKVTDVILPDTDILLSYDISDIDKDRIIKSGETVNFKYSIKALENVSIEELESLNEYANAQLVFSSVKVENPDYKYLMEYKFSVDVIRNFIIENPVVANLSFIEFERYVKIDTNNGN